MMHDGQIRYAGRIYLGGTSLYRVWKPRGTARRPLSKNYVSKASYAQISQAVDLRKLG